MEFIQITEARKGLIKLDFSFHTKNITFVVRKMLFEVISFVRLGRGQEVPACERGRCELPHGREPGFNREGRELACLRIRCQRQPNDEVQPEPSKSKI